MPQAQMPRNWTPPYPAWSAEFPPHVREVVIGCFAAQHGREGNREGNGAAFQDWAQAALSLDQAPDHHERAFHVDAQGWANSLYICYWTDRSRYDAWTASPQVASWWDDPERLQCAQGYWREVIFAPLNRLETLFSSEDGAGMAALAPGFAGPIREHAYWGAMRDRVPDSEGDGFRNPDGAELAYQPSVESRTRRVRIRPPENLCLIRSAQNWTQCKGEELAIYEQEVHPTLIKGMNYIRDNPLDSGCISCRFMEELTEDGQRQAKTFGLAYFLTMAHLEAWAKRHPSHLAIFRSFHEMVRKLNFQADLKLWHEVIVLPPGPHVFEYLNCHEKTGLLPFFAPDQRSAAPP